MTQPHSKMRYPKGRIILVRDSTVDICLKNNPGAVLLSVLLFWYDNPHKFDVDQGDEFTMCRTQVSIEEQACHQIDVKTIHDTAVPLLQLLGYLTVVEKMNGNLYTLHMDRILAAYAAYENGADCLKAYLKASMQLESAPIVMAPSELERTLINKNWLYFELERVLNANRVASNCKRGRKPKQKAASDSENANTETIRDSIETIDKENSVFTSAQTPRSYLEEFDGSSFEDEATVKQPAINLNGANDGQLDTLTASASMPGEPENSPLSVQTRHSHIPSSLQGTDGAATEGTGRPRASGKQEKPKRTRKKPVQVQLTLHEQEVKEWYEELRGVDVSFSKKNVTALQALGKRTMTKDDFLNVTAILDGDTWFEEHKIGVDLYWIERQWENKIIFLQRKKPPLADKKPMDVYTAASLDPERNKRNLERLKANRLAKEAAQGVSHGTN